MNIICESEMNPTAAIMDKLYDAATLAVSGEGLCPENIEISLSYVTKDEIHELNKTYRGVDRHTDVLSFPMVEDLNEIDDDPESEVLLGDVVICPDMIKEQAAEYGHSEEREAVYLFTHSMLHLLGYDHMDEEEKAEMRAREEEIMDALDLRR